MPIKNPKQIFVLMLSDLRQGAEKSSSIFQNLAQFAEDPDIESRPWRLASLSRKKSSRPSINVSSLSVSSRRN